MMTKEIKILIMEDTAFWGFMLKRELKNLGINSEWVKNGKLGVEKIQQGTIDYHGIITDIQLPLMDGLEATRRIRELGFTKPIIGFSSKGDREDVARGIEMGMNGYFTKSIDRKKIEALLNKLGILKEA